MDMIGPVHVFELKQPQRKMGPNVPETKVGHPAKRGNTGRHDLGSIFQHHGIVIQWATVG
jgi:hypothetical protein